MKHLLLLFLCLLITATVFAEDTASKDKITLLTGEVYTGEIVVKTDELVMIKTGDGKRYQFQRSQIKSIEKTTQSEASNQTSGNTNTDLQHGNFCGDIELSAGIASGQNAFKNSAITGISLIFGKKDISAKNLFFGIGASYEMLFLSGTNSRIDFVPAFIRLQNTFLKTKTAPFAGLDAGYYFSMNKNFGGGPFIRLFGGIVRKLSYKSDVYCGIFGSITSVSTNVTEINNNISYQYYGPTTMTTAGLRFGFHF